MADARGRLIKRRAEAALSSPVAGTERAGMEGRAKGNAPASRAVTAKLAMLASGGHDREASVVALFVR
jgi:hypothetical protein